ncbi:MAG: 3-hydroxyacyl-CoA dehydrogenase [Alphaproteobacteria bacterium]|nr:3-hydroxyacyl-CoA dehydrogenase [Alphaproteobacteria bacterium]MBP7759527.1 3-hydroxyacyl-CoA dehydrogenase [Alphaproteobacteria bacterium]MBP7762901.1 3-hydroxyacyl-CoA dehydrogenase [Alphaproteobacteria bacterium]MBP7905594.1 3-hydroxyacyl-CoA dehydrogenase [Alphaproteobacteria bacterium]
MKISKIAVIGAGVMGSGIAAQVANAGYPVVLLDIVPPDLTKFNGNRNAFAQGAVEKMLKTDPAPFMLPSNAKRITCGNLEDDLNLLADVDWIIEVVVENIDIKHKTYAKLEQHRKKGSIVSSNTSTIPLHKLAEGQSENFKKDFMITHFFNPPRYMRLLELITSKDTRKDAVETVRAFCDIELGKGVVVCHDTPGFIANRLGVFWLTAGINEAIKQKVSIETADAVMSKPVGIPKTGVFGLIDLVGIDLMPKLADSLLANLPPADPYRELHIDYPFVHQMIAAGYTGRKGKGGFYRLDPASKDKAKQAMTLNPDTFNESQYKAAAKEKPEGGEGGGKKGLRAVVEDESSAGKYAWEVLKKTLHYAALLVGEIADTVFDIDEAMKLGYNWKNGPFEMIDALGPKWFAAKLKIEGMEVPDILKKVGEGTFYRIEGGKRQYFGNDGKYHDVKRPEGVLLLSDIKLSGEPVLKNASAKVWDVGEGVLCFEHQTKMNTFDEEIFALLEQTRTTIEKSAGKYKALVIYNEGSHFSAGANLGVAIFMINIAMWPQVESFVAQGQKVFMNLKYAPFPVVSAPSGMALGGGCEILLASDAVQAHAETYCGLVEVGVGLIPGWGGCKEMILRLQERERKKFAEDMGKIGKKNVWFSPDTTPMGAARQAFETIGTAKVAKSAHEAVEIGYFRETDGISMNRDRLLYDARQRALKLAANYKAPEKITDIKLSGTGGKLALDMAVTDLQKSGKATPYDGVVSAHLAQVLTGGGADLTEKLTEDDLLKFELREFMKLVRNEGTLARIEHMLDKGKPLRN